MKRLVTMATVLGVSLTAMTFAQDQAAEEADASQKETFESKEEKISYAIGLNVGNSLKDLPVDIQSESLLRGLEDSLAGEEPALSEQEVAMLFQELQQQRMREMQQAAAENQEAGEEFLAEKKEEDGVESTESGLLYEVIEEGEGESPKESDLVTLNYRGELIDGTEFDSSYDDDEPVTMPANRFVPGFTEGLQLMKPGAEYKLYIPSDLAYGQQGRGQQIGPNATLVFTVELEDVKEAPEQPQGEGRQLQLQQGQQ